MKDIETLIDMLDRAGIRYAVDQSHYNDKRTLNVYVYDQDSFIIFDFDADNELALQDLKVYSGEVV